MQQHPITVVPNKISIAGKTYREGVDLSAEDALKLIAHQPYAPLITVPSEAQYTEVYTRLARSCDAIISIHASWELLPSWENAMAAARLLSGHCPDCGHPFADDGRGAGYAGQSRRSAH